MTLSPLQWMFHDCIHQNKLPFFFCQLVTPPWRKSNLSTYSITVSPAFEIKSVLNTARILTDCLSFFPRLVTSVPITSSFQKKYNYLLPSTSSKLFYSPLHTLWSIYCSPLWFLVFSIHKNWFKSFFVSVLFSANSQSLSAATLKVLLPITKEPGAPSQLLWHS